MIHVPKSDNHKPEILTKPAIVELIRTKNPKNAYYYAHDQVREALYGLYHDKCGYCEGAYLAGSELQIDHYRPKGRLDGEPRHGGYYWLAYEWTNLIPACQKCNGKKSDQFPLDEAGQRITQPSRDAAGEVDLTVNHISNYKSEHPLLLNPERDQPEKHLHFLPDGTLTGLTSEGKKTIEVCDLSRNKLVAERKAFIDRHITNLKEVTHDFLSKKITEDTFRYNLHRCFNNMVADTLPQRPFSRLARLLFFKFKFFLPSNLAQNQRELLIAAWAGYRKKHQI